MWLKGQNHHNVFQSDVRLEALGYEKYEKFFSEKKNEKINFCLFSNKIDFWQPKK